MGIQNVMELLTDTDTENLLAQKSDEEVLTLSQKNPDLFAEIIHRYEAAFLRKALTILREKEEAEEVVQEAFSKIYLYADKFEVQAGASFSSWAYRILMNTAFTRYQKLKKKRTNEYALDPEVYEQLADTRSEQFEKLELSDYVVSVLSEMPEQLARILTLHFIEGKPQKDIAKEEGISVGAVKTRVHRAKASFREHLKSIAI